LIEAKVEAPAYMKLDLAQGALQDASMRIGEEFQSLAASHEYVTALQLIATLRAPIDLFFEKVMVMADDPYLRWTRLSLLKSLVETFSQVADFSEIVTAG